MKLKSLDFNPSPPSVMHIDLNSCFASVEQQANPLYRGKPLVVAAYDSPGGCALAASVEAKRLGIKTGFRVREAKRLCPQLIVLTPDPPKYRHVNLALRRIFESHTPDFYPKSIDEFVLHFRDYLFSQEQSLSLVAQTIKTQIKSQIGDWLTVSVGIAPNRFLAKTASNLHKPDGLDVLDHSNFLSIYQKLSLTDLHGINLRNQARLNSVGIYSVIDFYRAPYWRLKMAFKSALASYWYSRLRGWEIDSIEFRRKSFGNSYAFAHHSGSHAELLPVLQKLVEKTGSRLRSHHYRASGVHLGLSFKDGSYWHKGHRLHSSISDSRDIFKKMSHLLSLCPHKKPVHTLSETCFNLSSSHSLQLEIFEDLSQKEALTRSLDQINSQWGAFTITPARTLLAADKVQDRIAFGLA